MAKQKGKKKGLTKIQQIEISERGVLYGKLPYFDKFAKMYIEERYALTRQIPSRTTTYAFLIQKAGGGTKAHNPDQLSYTINLSIVKARRSIKRSRYKQELAEFLEEMEKAIVPIMEKYSEIPESTRYVWLRTLLRALRQNKPTKIEDGSPNGQGEEE